MARVNFYFRIRMMDTGVLLIANFPGSNCQNSKVRSIVQEY